MIVKTRAGTSVNERLLRNYFHSLVNQFFKILPMRENEESSLQTYMQSLQVELLGCRELICDLRNDSSYLSLLSILQYLIDNPQCAVGDVKREVFKCISICVKLSARFTEEVKDE